jgi:ABC-type uncharacterized transport system ATPase component
MIHKHKPMFFVFAGNNGSGKSTFRNLIIDKMGVEINIDPDAIARKIDPINPETKRIAAGKEVIKSVNDYMNEGKDFSIETTLALAENPSGNLQTFNQVSSEKDNQMASDLQKLDSMIGYTDSLSEDNTEY